MKQIKSAESKPLMSQNSDDQNPILEITTTYKSFGRVFGNTMAALCGSMFFGYAMAYFSIYPIEQVITEFEITVEAETFKGILNAIVPFGAFFGAILSSTLLKYASRRQSLIIIAIIGIIGGVFTLFTTYHSLVFGRFVLGLAVGLYSAIVPLFINELAPSELAGLFGTFNQLFIVLSVVFTNLLTFVISDQKSKGSHMSSGWRLVFAGTIIIASVQLFLLLFIFKNQTPRYLFLKGRDVEARQLIQEIYLPHFTQMIYDKMLKQARPQLKEQILSTQSMEQSQPKKISNKAGNSTLAIFIGVNCAVLQQFCGINVIILYCGDIFQQVISPQNIKMCRTLLQAVSLIGCFGVAYFIKKFGRKQLIQIGAFLIAIILVIIGICFGSNTAAAKNTIVALLYIFIILFNFTLGPLVWLYIPEILQPKWVPFTTMVNWGASVITISLFPIIVNMFGSPLKIFFGLGIWCFIAGVINHFYMVQSKDRSLDEISKQYENKCK